MSQPPPESRPLLAYSAGQLAKGLGCSIRHIRRMDASGQLPKAVRLRRAKRWLAETIREWLDAGCPDRATWEAMQVAAGKDARRDR